MQGVDSIVCAKIEDSTATWNWHVIGQHMAPAQYSGARIPNCSPPESASGIKRRVHVVARSQSSRSQHPVRQQIRAEKAIQRFGIAVAEIGRGRVGEPAQWQRAL